ncbi:MAG: Energy-coupling factor transporter transmembrane protein EcfT [Candidatus Syntrophoarchaeum sp. GoM_oil]|nr:MAG: Energy-coupling factor transporter transmembrane protein EcfT [Candidatus Syntrophoarchaeum sp. GoM_oil]
MIGHIEIDRYHRLSSPIHNWDPRAKLVSILVLIFSIVLVYNLKMAVVGLFFAMVILLISRIPLSFVLSHIKWVILFVSPFIIILPLRIGDGGIGIDPYGLWYGSLIVLKAIAAVILIFPMIGTARFDTSLKALLDLKVPNKLVQMLVFTFRYIFVFIEEFHRLMRSLESRHFEIKTRIYTITTLGKAMGMLFVKSVERAERVYDAMISRGYDGILRGGGEFKMRGADWLKSLVILILAISLHIAWPGVM